MIRPKETELLHRAKECVRVKIKELLKARQWSYQDFADALGVSLVSVTRTLGGSQWFSFETLVKAAEVLDCPFADLFEYADDELFKNVPSPEKPEGYDFEKDLDRVNEFLSKRKKGESEVFEWFDKLPLADRILIQLRYFVKPAVPYRKIGNILGISGQRVAQLENKILKTL